MYQGEKSSLLSEGFVEGRFEKNLMRKKKKKMKRTKRKKKEGKVGG